MEAEDSKGNGESDELAPHVLNNVEGLGENCAEAGHGAYGVIYHVTVDGKQHVAKRLHEVFVLGRDSEGIKQKFRNECITLSRLKHPNIVHFVGVHYGRDKSDLSLIMECLPSSLSSFLGSGSHPDFPLPLKLTILLDVSCGLLYLHTHDPPIVHRDLTAHNILLTDDCRAKIADLGVAKLLTSELQALIAANKRHTIAPGQPLYMPPEVLTENPECTPKIDVFSFGHLSLFTINQEDPEVFELPPKRIRGIHRQGSIQAEKRRRALEMAGHDHCMYSLIIKCLRDNPSKRPNAVQLTTTMQGLCTKYPAKRDKKGASLFTHELEVLKKDLDEVTQERDILRTQVGNLEDEVQLYKEQRENEYFGMMETKEDEMSTHQKLIDSQKMQIKTLETTLQQFKVHMTKTATELQSLKEHMLTEELEKSYRQLVQTCDNLEDHLAILGAFSPTQCHLSETKSLTTRTSESAEDKSLPNVPLKAQLTQSHPSLIHTNPGNLGHGPEWPRSTTTVTLPKVSSQDQSQGQASSSAAASSMEGKLLPLKFPTNSHPRALFRLNSNPGSERPSTRQPERASTPPPSMKYPSNNWSRITTKNTDIDSHTEDVVKEKEEIPRLSSNSSKVHSPPDASLMRDKPLPLQRVKGTHLPRLRLYSNPGPERPSAAPERASTPPPSLKHPLLKRAISPNTIDGDTDDVQARELGSGYRERTYSITKRPAFNLNLVCRICDKTFKIGEAKLFRAHVERCDTTKSV